jgi:hypothetical protein
VHQENYNISSDWNGTAYFGLTLEWDYKSQTVDLSMPGYIKAALHKYQHPAPARPKHAPHTCNPPIYGAKTQFVTETTTSPALSNKEINKLQQLTGTLLYYDRDVDPTLIMPINVLQTINSHTRHSRQSHKTFELLQHSPWIKNTISFIWHYSTHSQWCFISLRRWSKKQVWGVILHGKRNKTSEKTHKRSNFDNIKVLKHGISSAAEAEIGAVFINAKEGAVLRTTLEELGHKQPPTPMETDNTTTTGYSNGTILKKRTKAMGMPFYWIKDRVKQGQFDVYWGPGFQNVADYFTKHHLPAHHKRMRDIYIHADERPMNREGNRDYALWGCVNTSGQANAQIPPPPCEMIHLPVNMHYVYHLTWFTRMCVASHSQPLINTKYQIQVTKYL